VRPFRVCHGFFQFLRCHPREGHDHTHLDLTPESDDRICGQATYRPACGATGPWQLAAAGSCRLSGIAVGTSVQAAAPLEPGSAGLRQAPTVRCPPQVDLPRPAAAVLGSRALPAPQRPGHARPVHQPAYRPAAADHSGTGSGPRRHPRGRDDCVGDSNCWRWILSALLQVSLDRPLVGTGVHAVEGESFEGAALPCSGAAGGVCRWGFGRVGSSGQYGPVEGVQGQPGGTAEPVVGPGTRSVRS
jgi:hypothetical protein